MSLHVADRIIDQIRLPIWYLKSNVRALINVRNHVLLLGKKYHIYDLNQRSLMLRGGLISIQNSWVSLEGFLIASIHSPFPYILGYSYTPLLEYVYLLKRTTSPGCYNLMEVSSFLSVFCNCSQAIRRGKIGDIYARALDFFCL